MSLPEAVRAGIEVEVGHIDRVDRVTGGSIASAYRLNAGGETFFLKCADDAPADFFAVEAAGLDLLREADSSLRIPRVAGFGTEREAAWLLLEWLESGRNSGFSTELGRGLARLHRRQETTWGLDRDGFIGSLPQSNRRRQGWVEFWWEERLLPQIVMAEGRFHPGVDRDDMRVAVERVLTPIGDEGPSLLHGDLWGGNVLSTMDGPAIFDPACYFGHREVDLAMTELFGGFDAEFYAGYDEVWPRRPGYPGRRAAYQLYYLLVHVNLFGGSYASRTRDTVRQLLAA